MEQKPKHWSELSDIEEELRRRGLKDNAKNRLKLTREALQSLIDKGLVYRDEYGRHYTKQ